MPKRIIESDAREFGTRLVALLESKKQPRRGAGAYLAKRYKVATVTANAWLNGEYKPSTSTARRIAVDHGATFDELYFGANPETFVSVPSDETAPSHIRLPLLEGYAGMGRGDYIGDFPEIVDFVEVTREWAAQKLHGVPLDAVRVITGRGDSNKGIFNDGDLLFVDSRIKQFDADSTYCYRWDGRVQIKKLQWIGNGNVRIISANKDYPPLDVPLKELEIGARVITGWTLIDL